MTITWKPYVTPTERGTPNYGGLGGFLMRGMRWQDYLDHSFHDEDHSRLEELRTEVICQRVWRDGRWHQDETGAGMPVWDDGAVFAASYRAWGDLMAAVWSTHLDYDYCYMDFYCGVPGLPKRARPSVSLPAVGSFG